MDGISILLILILQTLLIPTVAPLHRTGARTAFVNENADVFITGTLDSKGRITVPADVRSRLGLEPGDEICAVLNPAQVERIPVDDPVEAQNILEQYNDVRQFRYADGTLEVVQDEG